jgi:hypothetical protein
MAIQLMKLRHVPPDELEEIHALLEAHAIEVYETSAGNWGISLPALWLADESRVAEARALLDAYAAQRQERARSEYAALKAAGKARTFADIARENPLRFIACIVLVGAVAWFSLAPFLRFAGL